MLIIRGQRRNTSTMLALHRTVPRRTVRPREAHMITKIMLTLVLLEPARARTLRQAGKKGGNMYAFTI